MVHHHRLLRTRMQGKDQSSRPSPLTCVFHECRKAETLQNRLFGAKCDALKAQRRSKGYLLSLSLHSNCAAPSSLHPFSPSPSPSQPSNFDESLPAPTPYDCEEPHHTRWSQSKPCNAIEHGPTKTAHRPALQCLSCCLRCRVQWALLYPLPLFLPCHAAMQHTNLIICMWLCLLWVDTPTPENRSVKPLFSFDLHPIRRKCYTGKWVL